MEIAEAAEQLAEMERARGEIETEIATTITGRGRHALAAAQGDQGARKALAKLTLEEAEGQRKLRDAVLAVEAATVQLADARREAEAADLAERRATYDRHANLALDAGKEADAAAVALADALGRIRAAHGGMASAGYRTAP